MLSKVEGVVESVLFVLRQGVVLPWMTTLDHLHLKPVWLSAWWVIGLALVLIALIWVIRFPDSRKQGAHELEEL